MNRYIILGLMGLFAAGCGSKGSYVKKGEIQQTLDQQAETKTYFESIGIAGADQTLTNQSQRKATSRNAAIVQSQYEMLSMLKGVELEGGIRVERAIETDSLLETRIKDTIKGAEIVKTEWTNDDGCVVTLRLPKKRIEDVLGKKVK